MSSLQLVLTKLVSLGCQLYITLVNIYLALPVFTPIAGTS